MIWDIFRHSDIQTSDLSKVLASQGKRDRGTEGCFTISTVEPLSCAPICITHAMPCTIVQMKKTRNLKHIFKKLFLFPLPPTYSLDIFTLPQLPSHHRTHFPCQFSASFDPLARTIKTTTSRLSSTNWRLIRLGCAQCCCVFCFLPLCCKHHYRAPQTTSHKHHLTSIKAPPKLDQPTNQQTIKRKPKKNWMLCFGWFVVFLLGKVARKRKRGL